MELIEYSDLKNKDDFQNGFIKMFDKLIDDGLVQQYDNLYFDLTRYFLDELELKIDEADNSESQDGIIWNINSKKIKEKVNPIKSGGWGLTQGGWGHESKE